METLHIAPAEWASFLDSFSRTHAGWLVKLEVLGPGLGAQIEADAVPLLGISIDHDHGAPSIEITVGDRSRGEASHNIDGVKDVWVRTGEHSSEEALDIEAEGGVTLLTFQAGTS